MKSLILFTTTVLMMIQFTNSNILSDLANNINTGISNTLNSIRDSACVVSHRSDFDSCYDKVKDVYNGMGGNQDDQPNKVCTSFEFIIISIISFYFNRIFVVRILPIAIVLRWSPENIVVKMLEELPIF